MIKECPFCGSIRIVETLKGDKGICLNCESFLNDKSKPTVFDRITASPEVLAEKLVYRKYYILRGETWTSNVLTSEFETKTEAIAATVAKLKEVCDE